MNIQNVMAALRRKGYEVSFFETAEAAEIYLNLNVDQKTVGFGDSQTLRAMGLYASLSEHNHVIDPQHCAAGMDFYATAKQCLTTDVFLTSVNALAETGEMVNMDGTGNRIAGSLFGHEKVYFVVGINKIVPTLADAIVRTRNIAAPMNAARLGLNTPCAIKRDHCYRCGSEDRICCGQMIYYQKMQSMEMEVVLIQTPLGY